MERMPVIRLSAIEAARLLDKHPKAKVVANQAKKSKQMDELHGKVLAQLVGFLTRPPSCCSTPSANGASTTPGPPA